MIYIITTKPSKSINQLIHIKMTRIKKIEAEALILNEQINSCNIEKLFELQRELKSLHSAMIPYIKSTLISKILKERSQYF